MDRSKFDWYAITARANHPKQSEATTGALITALCVGCFVMGFGLGGILLTAWSTLW